MRPITYNPFRIIDVTAESSEKTLLKQKNKLERFAGIGKDIQDSFPFLSPIQRNSELIQRAFSDIENLQHRVDHALFWFTNLNSIDEVALNYLKSGENAKAFEIWQKLVEKSSVSERNLSAYNNLSTILMVFPDQLFKGISLKVKLICSDVFPQFIQQVADETVSIDNTIYLKRFLDCIYDTLSTDQRQEFLRAAKRYPKLALDYLQEKFTSIPFFELDKALETTESALKEGTQNILFIAQHLAQKARQYLPEIGEVLSFKNPQYQLYAENIAQYLIRCSVRLYNESDESKSEIIKKSIQILELANEFASRESTFAEINDKRDELTEELKLDAISKDLISLTESIKQLNETNPTMEQIKSFINVGKNRLERIKSQLGKASELYINISSAVVNVALGKLIDQVNDAQSRAQYLGLEGYSHIISNAYEQMKILSDFVTEYNLKTHFNKNYQTIIELHRDLSKFTTETRRSSSNSSSSSSSRSSKQSSSIDSDGCLASFIWVGLLILFFMSIGLIR